MLKNLYKLSPWQRTLFRHMGDGLTPAEIHAIVEGGIRSIYVGISKLQTLLDMRRMEIILYTLHNKPLWYHDPVLVADYRRAAEFMASLSVAEYAVATEYLTQWETYVAQRKDRQRGSGSMPQPTRHSVATALNFLPGRVSALITRISYAAGYDQSYWYVVARLRYLAREYELVFEPVRQAEAYLSHEERRVYELLRLGLPRSYIATQLGKRLSAIHNHTGNIQRKTGKLPVELTLAHLDKQPPPLAEFAAAEQAVKRLTQAQLLVVATYYQQWEAYAQTPLPHCRHDAPNCSTVGKALGRELHSIEIRLAEAAKRLGVPNYTPAILRTYAMAVFYPIMMLEATDS